MVNSYVLKEASVEFAEPLHIIFENSLCQETRFSGEDSIQHMLGRTWNMHQPPGAHTQKKTARYSRKFKEMQLKRMF